MPAVQEPKPAVSNADMAQLMNMSPKIVRAVEAWRARKVRPRSGGPGP